MEGNEGIRIILCRYEQAPEIRHLSDNDDKRLDEMQAFVGGTFSLVGLDEPTGLELWCNDNGIAEGLPLNWVIPAKPRERPPWLTDDIAIFSMADGLADFGQPGEWRIFGDFFLARSNDEGEMAPVTDIDVKWAETNWPKFRAAQVAADRFTAAMSQVNEAVARVQDLVVAGKCQKAPLGCGKEGITLDSFRDDESRQEYQYSALCQSCQDRVFNEEDDEPPAPYKPMPRGEKCPSCGDDDWNTTSVVNGMTQETTSTTTFCRTCGEEKETTGTPLTFAKSVTVVKGDDS